MAEVGAPTTASANTSQVKDTARNQLTQQVGKLVENSGSQGDGLVTELDAIAAAITAKASE